MEKWLNEIKKYPQYAEIQSRMENVQKDLGLTFKNTDYLALAFCRTKVIVEGSGKSNATYLNETLAQLGDALLRVSIAELCLHGAKTKKETEDDVKKFANNRILHSFAEKKGWINSFYNEQYFYNTAPEHERIPASGHCSCVEAIIGAIYLDQGWDTCHKWVLESYISGAIEILNEILIEILKEREK